MRKFFHLMSPLLKVLLSVFFDRKFLSGRHFDSGFDGYFWAIRSIWCRNILRLGTPAPWPIALGCHLSNPKNIHFHPDNVDNFQSPGTYFQNFKGQIYLGRGTYIAPNVGLITANHNFLNLDEHDEGKDIVIGEHCWIGMNAIILPGVVLGDRTIVAAGAVVSKSFPDGYVVIGGVPAMVIKTFAAPDQINQTTTS